MMPPKSKSKKADKGKASAVVDGLSTAEMSKDQLEEHIIRLREELDRVREEKRYFQLETDKIQASWEISKNNLEEAKAELRNRQREREEAKERHRVEITAHKQKLRHVLAERHNTVSGMKVDSVASTSLIQNQHTESELSLQREKQDLQADLGERKLLSETFNNDLKLKHQVELKELANDYDKRIAETVVKYQERMWLIRAEMEKQMSEVGEFEGKMIGILETVMKDHAAEIRKAADCCMSVQERLLREMMMKKELTEKKRVDKRLSAAMQENRRLKESLQEAQQKLPELKKQLEEKRAAKEPYERTRARKTALEKKLRDLKMEYVSLELACEKLQKEQDELSKKEREAILDTEQKSDLRDLLAERKMAVLTETLEKKEAQLYAALSISSDQSVHGCASKKLEEMFESKQATISALQCDLAQACKDYEDQLQAGRTMPQAVSDPE